jgi:Co/Zn/Cd efflux system component
VKDDLISNLMPLKEEIEELLEHKFGIEHTTIQFEIGDCNQELI